MAWEINMGICPRLGFGIITLIYYLVHGFYIFAEFDFLCNSIANF